MKTTMRSFGNVSGLTIQPGGLDLGLGGPNRSGHVTGQSISRTGTTLRIRPQPGYYPGDSGNSVQWDDPNWIAANIRQGVSIFGLEGTFSGNYAEGTAPISSDTLEFNRAGSGPIQHQYVTVSGLNFLPRVIVITKETGDYRYGETVYYDYFRFNSTTKIVCLLLNYEVVYLTGNAYVNATGFRLPVNMAASSVKWVAYG